MAKPNKKIIEKLKLFSELSYDNTVRISSTGNYFIRLTEPTCVDFIQEFRPDMITKGTYKKLLTKVPIKYSTHQNMLMLTKGGKLLIGIPKPVKSAYKGGITWKALTIKNFNKNLYYLRRGPDSSDEIDKFRSAIQKILFLNSKSKWLLEKPFYTLQNGLKYNIFYNYKSFSEMKKDLGYGFISDKVFESIITFVYGSDRDEQGFISDEHSAMSSYANKLFNIILYGKMFSEKSRKNLIIILLNIFAIQSFSDKRDCIVHLASDFYQYISRVKNNNDETLIEIPNDLKSLTLALSKTVSNLNSNDDEEEILPF